MKELRVNGREYTGLQQLRDAVDDELYLFLQEWYNDLPYVVGHTSGSTGKPREIRLVKSDMRASALITNRFFGIHEDSVLLLCLSASYIAGKMMVVRALEAGAELWVVKVSSHPLQQEIKRGEKRIDLAAMVPMQLEETLKSAEETERLDRIRHLIIGGAPVSAILEERLGKIPVACYATYGMTETVSHVALRKLNQGPEYFALGNVAFELDERGCLIVNAPHLEGRRFVTNDLVKLKDPHHFEWLGRVDHVINSGGIKFYPESIERKLSRCLSGRYFITSRPDDILGEAIVLLLEGENCHPEEIKGVVQRVRSLLDRYEMPKAIGCCPYFQKTSSGKVIRTIPEKTVWFPVGGY